MTASRRAGKPSPGLHHNPQAARYAANRRTKTAANAAVAEQRSRTALVLGGGAPNSALMAGALAAFEERGVQFDVVSTSGPGALVGLLWLAPKNASPGDALRNWVDAYVDDTIYDLFPVNYKVFFKPGGPAEQYRTWLNGLPGMQRILDESRVDGWGRLWRDWAQLVFATLSPTSLNLTHPLISYKKGVW